MHGRIAPANAEWIAEAGHLIRSGALVAFPTETVYGLGADATNGEAVARVFDAKGRPAFNPLIVHVLGLEAAEAIGLFSPTACGLAQTFWPGPLTLVVPRRDEAGVSDLVSAGLPTIALRAPDHPVARALLSAAQRPIAAPSANRSGHVSATRAGHVAADLGDKAAVILDGGPTTRGLESTVLSLAGETPVLLRPGAIPAEAIEKVVGEALARRPRERRRPDLARATSEPLRAASPAAAQCEHVATGRRGTGVRHSRFSPGARHDQSQSVQAIWSKPPPICSLRCASSMPAERKRLQSRRFPHAVSAKRSTID